MCAKDKDLAALKRLNHVCLHFKMEQTENLFDFQNRHQRESLDLPSGYLVISKVLPNKHPFGLPHKCVQD